MAKFRKKIDFDFQNLQDSSNQGFPVKNESEFQGDELFLNQYFDFPSV